MDKRDAGFTLLEVLIALVIISVAFAAVIFSVNNNTRTVIHLEDTTAANWVATNIISQAELGLLGNKTAGFEQQLSSRYYWTITQKATENSDVIELEVKVSDAPNGSPIVTMQAYKGPPNDS